MADIKDFIDAIKNAVYGEEVRGSIVGAIEKVNDDNESYIALKQEVIAAKDRAIQSEGNAAESAELAGQRAASIEGAVAEAQSAASAAGLEATRAETAKGGAEDARDAAVAAAESVDPSLLVSDILPGTDNVTIDRTNPNRPIISVSTEGLLHGDDYDSDGDVRAKGGIKAWVQNFFDSIKDSIVSLATPTGSIKLYAGAVAPAGFLLCQGQAISRTTHAKLYAICGTTFGTGDGSTTFNLPDMRGRFPLGFDSNLGIGSTGGKSSVAASNLPQHAHPIPALSGTAASAGAHTHPYILNTATGIATSTGSAAYPATSGSSTNTSSSGAHSHNVTTTASNTGNVGTNSTMDILNPFLALTYIIKT